jgi:hypothetical protein
VAVNYEDKRFTDVKNQEATAIKETKGTYDKMINQSDKYYQQQIDATKEWEAKQNELQQAQTDFTIDKIEQQKEQANKNYVKEQKGAYTDYQKATNQYGSNAEKLAVQGLNQTGYSESTRTSAYNTYQNRYATARESYNQAILNYDNGIREAQLANNAALAQIAYESLQKQLELSLQGFQYKNTLVLQRLDAVNQQKDRYYQRWRDVESQINTENAFAEQQRQFNESMAFQKQQAAQEQANWEKQYALSVSKNSGGGSESKLTKSAKKLGSKAGSASSKSSSGSAKLGEQVSSGTKNTSSSSGSSSKAVGKDYNTVLKAANIQYNISFGKNKKAALEAYLGNALAQDKITEYGAQQILKIVTK